MTNGGTPGGSATDQAARLRRRADLWEQGAEGERLTAAALVPLAQQGYHVFHDVRVPGSRANIDHLVVGRTGVFVIDSKNFTSRLSFNKGTLWAGRSPQTRKLATTRWGADQISQSLGIDVTAVQCIHGTKVPLIEGRWRACGSSTSTA